VHRVGRRLGHGLALALVVAGGCVYPASEPTGVELSWRFVEHNEVDGEDAVQVRSCIGASTEQIAVEITDDDEPQRHGVFRFDCLTGYQTAVELQTAASDAFVRLDAGGYALGVLAVDDADNAPVAEHVAARNIDVADRGVTVEIWELRRAPVTWQLELQGADTCDELTLSLVYSTPAADLPELTPSDDDVLPLYREGLRSVRDPEGQELEVGGQATACTPALDGVHRFEGMDRGDYLLELDVDGIMCAVRVDLRGRDGATSVIDLASLPCQG
jgi:hypothetical protein